MGAVSIEACYRTWATRYSDEGERCYRAVRAWQKAERRIPASPMELSILRTARWHAKERGYTL